MKSWELKGLIKGLAEVSAELDAAYAELPRKVSLAHLRVGIAQGRLIALRERLPLPSDHKSLFPVSRVAGSRQLPTELGCASSRNRKSAIANRKSK